MRRTWIGFAALILCFVPLAVYAQVKPSDAEINWAIAHLSDSTDEKGFANFETLYKNPRRSAELLVASLKPIRRGEYTTGKHPQVVWDIRALRSLTNIDFRATTQSHLTEDESHFLDRNASGEIHFFGTWMSRDRVWVAPLDAQTVIIEKWREWFRKNGQTFAYVNDRNLDNWYF